MQPPPLFNSRTSSPPKETLYTLAVTPHFPSSPSIYLLWICLFWTFHKNGIVFCVWLLSLGMFLRFCVAACISTSFFFMAEYYSIVSTLSTCQVMDNGDASTYWLLCIMLLWTFIYKLLCWRIYSILLGTCLGEELLGHMVTLFSFLMNSQTNFQKDFYYFTLLPTMYDISNFSTPHQYF